MTDLRTSIPYAVTLLLGGGITASFLNVVKARTELRASKAQQKKQPLEEDNLFLHGAETAVTTMQKSVEAAWRQIEDLKRDNKDKQARLDEKEKEIETLKHNMYVLTRKMDDLQDAYEAVLKEVATVKSRQDGTG